MRLKDRNKFPPGGFRYYVPETRWSISPWISFEAAVGQIIAHRQGNTYLTQTKGWSLDPFVVSEELDAFNTGVCQQMGWKDYITEGGPTAGDPKALNLPSGSSRSARLAVEGVRTIAEWELAGGNIVPHEQSNRRAQICSTCVKNETGDLLTFFTETAAKLIKLQLETRNNMKLRTDFDPLLGVCSGCGCVMKLKVHCPAEIILKKMSPETKAALASNCWIHDEEKALNKS